MNLFRIKMPQPIQTAMIATRSVPITDIHVLPFLGFALLSPLISSRLVAQQEIDGQPVRYTTGP